MCSGETWKSHSSTARKDMSSLLANRLDWLMPGEWNAHQDTLSRFSHLSPVVQGRYCTNSARGWEVPAHFSVPLSFSNHWHSCWISRSRINLVFIGLVQTAPGTVDTNLEHRSVPQGLVCNDRRKWLIYLSVQAYQIAMCRAVMPSWHCRLPMTRRQCTYQPWFGVVFSALKTNGNAGCL